MPKLEHFQYMIEVARTKSISKAAENLYVSQPYLSQSLKELEQELGIQLLTRSHRGVVLTDAGSEFVSYAHEILGLVAKVKDLAENRRCHPNRLAVSSIYSFTMLDLFEGFTKGLEKEGTKIYYEEIPNLTIPDKVASGSSDVGLIYLRSATERQSLERLEELGLIFHPLCQEPAYAVLGYRHPLAKETRLTPEQLEDYPLLIEKIKNGEKNLPQEDNNLFPHLFVRNEKMPIVFDNNRSLMYYLTKSDRCFTVGQKSLNLSNPFYISRELCYIPIEDAGAYTTTGYILRSRPAPCPIVQHFARHLRDFFDRYRAEQELPL